MFSPDGMDPLRTDAKVNPPSSTMRFAAMGSVGARSRTRKALWNAVRLFPTGMHAV